MEMQIIYDSNKKTAEDIAFSFDGEVKSVRDNPTIWADVIFFICPTYGDEELPHDMEDYLLNIKLNDKFFVICEIGNYYGYDDFTFGPKIIIEKHLHSLRWKKFFSGFSLDVIPIVRWDALNKWKEGLYEALRNRSS